jgi:predicted nucleic acid-binding protein
LNLAIVVSDTSPIRALAYLELLSLLKELFERVFVPPAVDDELLHPPVGLPIVDVRTLDFAHIQAPRDLPRIQQLLEKLDPGEAEALVLGLEIGVSAVLIDETAGRVMAKRLGLVPIGVLGLLVRAKQRGLVDAVGPLVDQLERDLGFFISKSLRAEIVHLAGES